MLSKVKRTAGMFKLLSFIKGKVKRTTGKFKLLSFIKGPLLNGSLILIHDITQETSRTLYNTIANTTMMLSNMIGPMEKIALNGNAIKNFFFFVSGAPLVSK